ncbi:hypothetical protein C0966_17570 (plasmid) [Bacillus methanolicus]|uniref:hypothetical protein n=1 Tax=Bacillus methanolicus TaxID=1471 RepID=UPI00237FDEDA|nr:hypothetical protein [Bacillus methanolicus]MDE3841073.1 hypothetical protein [Bacillus methanolicus]
MIIHLKVHFDIEGNKLMQSGTFTVRKEEDIPTVAYKWIQKIKRETGYRDTRIDKVIVNNEKDITEEVRALDEAPIPDIDIF